MYSRQHVATYGLLKKTEAEGANFLFGLELRTSLLTLYFCLPFVAANWQATQQRPEALAAMEETRRAILSGHVEWSVMPEGDEKRVMSFVSRYALNGDLIFENRGDREGWTIFEPETRKGTSRIPQLYLVGMDGTWCYQETDLRVTGWKRDGRRSPWDEDIRDICSKHAQEIVDRHKARFEELYNRLGEAKDKDSDAPEKVREIEELEKQLAKLREPIDAIFERQLKPRLEKIPTRAQREAAEQAAAPATTQAEPTEPRRP